MHVLVVDDEPSVLSSLVPLLEREGFSADAATSGEEALLAAQTTCPDLVVLDVALPGMSGLAVCRQLRRRHPAAAVILLTARAGEAAELEGFAARADDYLVKPVSPSRLLAHVRAVLHRRLGLEGTTVRRFGGVEVDLSSASVRADGRVVALTRREYQLLVFLLDHPRQVFSREQLLSRVWGPDFPGTEGTVARHVSRLRLLLEPDPQRPRHLLTRPGLGYLLDPR